MTLAPISRERRAAIRAGASDRAEHARLLATLGFEGVLDVGAPASDARLGASARVVAWNLERCRFVEASASLLRDAGADVCLLTELDFGMARSGQRHTARDLAAQLGFAFAYGVEFLELDEPEHPNEVGFHGNAILSRSALIEPRLVRLDRRGDWFDGARGERRVGGRCAVIAQIELAGRRVTFASAHLDSHGTREDRAAEMRVLLDAIDALDAAAPAVIGGDLNSFSLALSEIGDPARVAAALREAPDRWSNPVPHEPLFAEAAARGFEWSTCNAPGVPTLRHATPDGGSARGAMKIDWFLARGIAASDPRVIEAVGPDRRALSDHEAIACQVGV